VPDQVTIENSSDRDGLNLESEGNGKGKNPAVTKERIERLKKAFRPSWLIEMINSAERGSSHKK